MTRLLAAAAGAGLLLAAGVAAPDGWLARLQAERGEPAALTSQWRTEPVVVDGKPDEWSALTPFEAVHLGVGVSNDDRTLQIALTSSDQARRRQLVAAGVIVWLDAGGGKKRSFGVRFPGLLGSGTRPELGRRSDRRAPDQPPPDHPPLDRSDGAPSDLQLPPLTWFELMGPGKDDRRRLERSAVTSIQVARDLREGMLVLELQVPLAKEAATGFGIGAEPGRVLGLGLETPEMEKPEGPPPGRGGRGGGRGMGGGGMGGMGGGMGRGGMGGGRGPDDGPRGERVERAKPLKVWTTVQLAARPGS